MQSRVIKVFFAAAIIIVLFADSTVPVHAASTNAQGLQISPVLVDLNADPGLSYTFKFSLLNVTTGDLLFNAFVNDFRAKDESGTPEVVLDSTGTPQSSVISWVSPIHSLTLKSKESKTIDVHINVPTDAEPGGHYGVIRFSGVPPSLSQSGVALAASAGTLLLVRVSGNIKESLNLKDFYVRHNDRRSTWFETGPVTFVERLNNTGNVHVKPHGDITITNLLGKRVATLKINAENGNILPDSTRRFEQTLSKKWLFGKYTATTSLAYGTTGGVVLGSLSFWVIPYKIILAVLALILLIFLITRFIIKRYNAKIIKRAMNENHKRKFR